MERLTEILDAIDGFVWGPFCLIPLLLGTGLWLTIRLRGIQFRKLGSALWLGFIKRSDDGTDSRDGDISQYQALTTALAATVGTGNIVGVATALSIGGPGALFWMWVTGLLGMASKYSEAFLAVRFRHRDKRGDITGGPQYYLKDAIGGKFGTFLATFFSIAAAIAAFGIGNGTQANSIAGNIEGSFGVPTVVTGLVMVAVTVLVLIGGIQSIGKVTSALVPVMIAVYVVAALILLGMNAAAIPAAFAEIFRTAFTGTAAAGGFTGSAFIIALQMGTARGIFSNESGMGSAAIAAAAAKTAHPTRQGLVSMTQTFIDTIIVVTMTGLVIVTTGTWQGGKDLAATMTGQAFDAGLRVTWGHYIVTISLVLFAYSTILGWCYYGERNIEKLLGRRWVMPYRIVFSLAVFVGCTAELGLVWTFSDIANGLMALPNLIGLLICSGLIARETKFYLDHDPKLRADKAEVDEFMTGHRGAIDAHWESIRLTAIHR
ncbi:sodium:alanine symporter family protein [Propionimicrobium sp. PCR01-08-3]|uniref:alanine/glycine:cation symporter family protein n=1 Tax=Propionimicrobium sp. PCR01-08-3 TaxID=3052086 RepID=UPI00255D08F7|nr:sodium:alanine symporter family protein [Propionimicrobium sp. PCR01-08-3]WIY82263.1 sodium:alanine symporter family protein [Propionimicrobium sp. PCR01-08-3]